MQITFFIKACKSDICEIDSRVNIFFYLRIEILLFKVKLIDELD